MSTESRISTALFKVTNFKWARGPSIVRVDDPFFTQATVLGYPSEQAAFAERLVALLNAARGVSTETLKSLRPGDLVHALQVCNDQIGNG